MPYWSRLETSAPESIMTRIVSIAQARWSSGRMSEFGSAPPRMSISAIEGVHVPSSMARKKQYSRCLARLRSCAITARNMSY
jgi:hypothetical protein